VLRDARPSTRTGRAAALTTYFYFLELRHKVELHNLTARMIECPLDEINRPRASVDPQLRIPPTADEVEQLFAGWRAKLVTCRKFAPAARNYAVARLAADVGLRINEARMLDLDDVRWELGRFGKLNVRHGKGSRRKGPKPRLVSLINGADEACAGSSKTCSDASISTRLATWCRCSRLNARTPTARAGARPPTCSAARWPRPPTGIFPRGRGS
jgi:integrase